MGRGRWPMPRPGWRAGIRNSSEPQLGHAMCPGASMGHHRRRWTVLAAVAGLVLAAPGAPSFAAKLGGTTGGTDAAEWASKVWDAAMQGDAAALSGLLKDRPA